MFGDTPLPPEEPAGENPPDGAILDYVLTQSASEVLLEVLDGSEVIRRYSSDDAPEEVNPTSLRHPTYWIRPPQSLATERGHHRFVWDLRHTPPPGSRRSFAIAAVHARTPVSPAGPLVHPGTYTIRLTVDGIVSERELRVRMDPRVEISDEALRLQTENTMACYRGYLAAQDLREAIEAASLAEGEQEAWSILRGALTRRRRHALRQHLRNITRRRDGDGTPAEVSLHDDAASASGCPADRASDPSRGAT